MKLKEIIIYASTIAINVLLGFLFTLLFFKNESKYLVFGAGIAILISSLSVMIVAQKMDYKLDLLAQDLSDPKHLLLNSIFIGNFFTIPIFMIISVII